MSWIKKTTKKLSEGFRKILPAKTGPGPTVPPLPGSQPDLDAKELVGKIASEAVDNAKDKVAATATDIKDKTLVAADTVKDTAVKVGGDIKDIYEDVAEFAEPVTEPVGKALDEIEHFAQTGDFGHAIVKLQEKEAQAQIDLKTAQAEYLETARDVITAHARLKSLSVVHETQHKDIADPADTEVDAVNVDLYGDYQTELLEDIGLGKVANAIKFVRSFTFMPGPTLIAKQIEYAEQRKALRANIDELEQTTAEVTRAKDELVAELTGIRSEIARLEEQLKAAGIEDDTSAASELRVRDIEHQARLLIARALLADGTPPETVAALTNLTLEQISD